MRKVIRAVFILILILVLLGGALAVAGRVMFNDYINTHRDTYSFSGVSFSESTDAISNPYIGYFDIYSYRISEDRYIGMEVSKHIEDTGSNARLVLLEVDLEDYADGPISEHGLMEIESLLSMWSAAGKDVMVRFLYDLCGKASETEPKSIDIIKLHMSQCADILNRYADDVYLTQSVFVGNIGEMHGSDYMKIESLRELADHYASLLDPGIFLSVRTPEQYRIICKRDEPITQDEAFSDELDARIGLFNDGMLGSSIDLGTYGDLHRVPTEEHGGKGDRAEEIAFQNEMCRFVPNGGEVVIDNEFNDLMPAVKDLRDMHVSYVGRYYDEAVKEKWRNSSYESAGHGDYLYEGMNGYDYIGRHLGYRYVIQDAYDIYRDITAERIGVAIDIDNVGFSNAYHRFDIAVCLKGDDGTVIDIPVDEYGAVGTDNRFWNSGEVSQINMDIPIDQLTRQEYEIWLSVKDPLSDEMIILANNEYSPRDGIVIGRICPDQFSEEEAKEMLKKDIETEGVAEVAKRIINEYVSNR